MKIKTIGIKYPQQRLVMNKVPNVEYSWVQNYANPFLKRYGRFEVWYPFFDFDIDGYHTVNTVVYTKKPWCCSFEDYVPRGSMPDFWELAYWGKEIGYNSRIDYLLKYIAKPNCKKLIALSECNLEMQRRFYKNFNKPELTDLLEEKTTMLKVPQELQIDSPKTQTNKTLKFVFVGNDFVRKGGREIVEVFRLIRQTREDFELHIVSIIEGDGYNTAFRNNQDSKLEYKELLQYMRSQDWIHLYSRLPNNKVLELLKSCDVGLLPTWFDTYGYSVLEMQACGLPVISTNVRALSEINNNGWIINLPVNFNNEVLIMSEEIKRQTRLLLQKQLSAIIVSILDNPSSILHKGNESWNYIRKSHSPVLYSNQIAEIYENFNL